MNRLITILIITATIYGCSEPPQKLIFKNSIQDVTDSLNVMRELAKFNLVSEPNTVQNCYIDFWSSLIINNKKIGKFDIINKFPNKYADDIKTVYSGDMPRLINLLTYLRNNYIDGYCVNYTYHICVFGYKKRQFSYDNKVDIVFKDDLEVADKIYDEKYSNIKYATKYLEYHVIKDETKDFVLVWFDRETWRNEVGLKEKAEKYRIQTPDGSWIEQ